MTVMILDSASPSLRGELSRWMIEPRAGVFVGAPSAMVRDRLWARIERSRKKVGGATLIWRSDTEQGYRIRTLGDPTRTIRDFDGLLLVQKP